MIRGAARRGAWTSSLAARFLALSALWTLVTLVAAWVVIGGGLDRFVTDRFRAEQRATSDAIVAALTARADGAGAELSVPILDPRYERPLSGWYWQVSGAQGTLLTSPSLFLDALDPPWGTGPDGAALFPMTRAVTIPDHDEELTVVVTAPAAALARVRSEILRPLFWSLAALGGGLALLTLVQGRMALGGFSHIGRGIAEIRAGRTERLSPTGRIEIDAPIDEINALLEANRRTLGRTREHVGNLAHALKTPLAALLNAAPEDSLEAATARRMDRLVRYHLRRARGAGQANLLGNRSPVVEVAEDIATVLRAAARDRHVALGVDCPEHLDFAGDREDLEEILGNLAENAVAWAGSRVDITARALGPDRMQISVTDDGPGIPEESRALALSRGGRLDEATLGSGLGLGIVADLVALNGGTLSLGRAEEGGLAARATLPRAPG